MIVMLTFIVLTSGEAGTFYQQYDSMNECEKKLPRAMEIMSAAKAVSMYSINCIQLNERGT